MGSIALWIASGSWAFLELGRAALLLGASSWLWVGLAGLGGWLLSDALSGGIHYLADNFGDPDFPILGPALIAPFREHHEQPLAIVSHDLPERSGTLCFSAFLLAGWVGPFLAGRVGDPIGVGLSALALSTACWIALTGEIHAWAHGLKPPEWARLLYGAGLVLGPQKHAVHHEAGHSSHYFITSGFWNRFDRTSQQAPRR